MILDHLPPYSVPGSYSKRLLSADSQYQSLQVSAITGNAVPNTKTNGYELSLNSGSSTSLSFDANGNMTSDGTNTYAWDAENRLIQITYPGSGNYSQFTYEPAGRLVKIVETVSGSVTNTKQFVFCGYQPCEARDGAGAVISQYFALGQLDSGAKRFYVRNRIGSITEVCDNTGALIAQMSYTPFGEASIQGSYAPDFQFDGYYTHARSALSLTHTRPYNSSLGRFMNRDQIQESGGVNLFVYASNDPILSSDPSGTGLVQIQVPGGPSFTIWIPDSGQTIAGGGTISAAGVLAMAGGMATGFLINAIQNYAKTKDQQNCGEACLSKYQTNLLTKDPDAAYKEFKCCLNECGLDADGIENQAFSQWEKQVQQKLQQDAQQIDEWLKQLKQEFQRQLDELQQERDRDFYTR